MSYRFVRKINRKCITLHLFGLNESLLFCWENGETMLDLENKLSDYLQELGVENHTTICVMTFYANHISENIILNDHNESIDNIFYHLREPKTIAVQLNCMNRRGE